MTISRRSFLGSAGAAGATLFAPAILKRGRALAQSRAASAPRLANLPVLDATATASLKLTAAEGSTEFSPGAASPTLGFNGSYLGPVLRLRTGTSVEAVVENRVREPITVHWHGLLVPGEVDGGPHLPIAPGTTWRPRLDIDQAPATLWYHSHIHRRTAEQVYAGLAGGLIVTDGADAERGLPSTMGVDDLFLVIQDKLFDQSGRLLPYRPAMPDLMMGYFGERVVVNGQMDRVALVPAGLVRLRLLNASNARNYVLYFEDRRSFHLAGTDQGLLERPVELDAVRLAPAERVEILVDFSEHGAARLVSLPHAETVATAGMPMMGMLRDALTGPFAIVEFAVDDQRPAATTRMPASFHGGFAKAGDPVRQRSFIVNDMMMGAGMRGGRGGEALFAINGQPFDMGRIDFEAEVGTTEHWRVVTQMMAHPIHIHGVQFEVLSENGRTPLLQNSGLKDTVLVEGEAELLVRFLRSASAAKPFMFHCHILEHEDNGLMGQFAAT